MSFAFSQTLLGDTSSSYPGPLSQEMEDSQDSGYAVYPTTLPLPPSAPSYNASGHLPFPPRRTLPRPPTWTNLNQPQQGGSKWHFGGSNDWGRNHLERDLQNHLTEILGQVTTMPGKVSTIVEESIKYLHSVHSSEGSNVREELKLASQMIEEVKKEIKIKDTQPVDMGTMLAVLETGLSDCAALAESSSGREDRMKAKLSGLLYKMDLMASISYKIEDGVTSVTGQVSNTNQINRSVGRVVTKEMKTINPVPKDHFSPPSSSILSTKPLPSIRRLPTLPLQSAASELSKAGMVTGNVGVERIGAETRERQRGIGVSWRRVRREAGYGLMDSTVKREKRSLI